MSIAKILPEYAAISQQVAELSRDAYYEHVFCHPMSFYRERVAMIGAQGFDRVLDVGQGYGQWTVALAESNTSVFAIDHSEQMCQTTKLLLDHYGVKNADVAQAPVKALDGMFEPGSFDLIWCWGVIMFVDRETTLQAFNRLLAPGGQVILGCVNTPERWLYKAEKGRRDGIVQENFFRFCEQGADGLDRLTGVNAYSRDPKVTASIVEPFGFELVALDYDGRIDRQGLGRQILFESLDKIEHENVELVLRKQRNLP